MKTDQPLKVIAGTPDRPVVIGDIEIPCYVLEDETRVLSQQGFLGAVGRARKAKGGYGARTVDAPPSFLAAKNLKPFVSNELTKSTASIPFQTSEGRRGYGYQAELLPQVCIVYLKARDAGMLLSSQRHIAKRAEILIRGLAEVGVIALVDEATGYQEIRARRALANILEKFIAKELQPWTKTFPYEFYKQIFRLKKWPGPYGRKRSPLIGRYTNNIVYERLAPGVLEELKRLNPTLPSGRRKNTRRQWFTPDWGHPKLRERLVGVIALMKAAPNWTAFKRSLERVYGKKEESGWLDIDYGE